MKDMLNRYRVKIRDAQAELTREETLKEVGEWLNRMPTIMTPKDRRGRAVLVYHLEIKSLLKGKMPEQEQR